jgi:hypothetical protein
VVGRELRKRIARAFAERGIEMARPFVSLRMDPSAEADNSKLKTQNSKNNRSRPDLDQI